MKNQILAIANKEQKEMNPYYTWKMRGNVLTVNYLDGCGFKIRVARSNDFLMVDDLQIGSLVTVVSYGEGIGNDCKTLEEAKQKAAARIVYWFNSRY